MESDHTPLLGLNGMSKMMGNVKYLEILRPSKKSN